jgi:RNA polymerase sigma-70 factor (ECF subfamily)
VTRSRENPEPAEVPSDGTVVQAVLEGRREQFGLLVARYQSPLILTAESRLGRRDWAEDVVQETFLCAFKWLATYDSRYSFRTWLWTILINQCRRQYKRLSKRSGEVSWDAMRQGGDAAGAGPRDERSELPLTRLLAEERRNRLRQLLQQLPDVQADALRLRFFGGLKFQEIADAMGCSLSSAKNRVRWGLMRLSEKMNDESQRDRFAAEDAADLNERERRGRATEFGSRGAGRRQA